MSASINAKLQTALLQLKDKQQYRKLPDIEHQGRYVIVNDNTLLNIASNDYLGLGSDAELQREFFEFIQQSMDCLPKMSATSSRLLTGNDTQLQA
ncbi:8-amino-7-oxononanoate synthase, partial [Psychrobacter sp. 1Y4]